MIWKGLICDHNSNKVSIGRVLLWLTFTIIAAFWIKGFYVYNVDATLPKLPESLTSIFWSLLVYNVFEKGRSLIEYTKQPETKKQLLEE